MWRGKRGGEGDHGCHVVRYSICCLQNGVVRQGEDKHHCTERVGGGGGEEREKGRGRGRERRGEERRGGKQSVLHLSSSRGGEEHTGTGPGEERDSDRPTRQEARDQGPRCPGQKQRRLRAAAGL